jgi:hypothetical protein
MYSSAEGVNTIAQGNYTHAEGYGTIATAYYSHVQGKYNVEDNSEGEFHKYTFSL